MNYHILDQLSIDIQIESNDYKIPPEKLFAMAARKNRKRNFLFVSKVLGKHIPVIPAIALLTGRALAMKYLEEIDHGHFPQTTEMISVLRTRQNALKTYNALKQKPLQLSGTTLFIGFAETATALGHAMFENFAGEGFYIHTTREMIPEMKRIITFEEEHSHATSHRLYPIDHTMLQSSCPLVLVDDEITTGKTVLNIIDALHSLYPRQKYTVVSILDWRSASDKALFKAKERELGIQIKTLSLISGNIEVKGKISEENGDILSIPKITEEKSLSQSDISVEYLYLDSYFPEILYYSSVDCNGRENNCPYLVGTGRFGISKDKQSIIVHQVEKVAAFLNQFRKESKTLCMGTGEFMYIPMLIAAHMGEDVYYQSTTRSPIYPYHRAEYGARNAFSFVSPDDEQTMNYFYNIPNHHYDHLFVFLEREVESDRLEPLLRQLKKLGIKNIFIVICTRKKGGMINV